MEIISQNEVVLTSDERFANARFEAMLDRGFSVRRAATRTKELFPGLDPEFYRWLRGPVNISPWHGETWNHVCDTLREELEQQGFEVHVNAAAGELTIIERITNKALTVSPVSNTIDGPVSGISALAH